MTDFERGDELADVIESTGEAERVLGGGEAFLRLEMVPFETEASWGALGSCRSGCCDRAGGLTALLAFCAFCSLGEGGGRPIDELRGNRLHQGKALVMEEEEGGGDSRFSVRGVSGTVASRGWAATWASSSFSSSKDARLEGVLLCPCCSPGRF